MIKLKLDNTNKERLIYTAYSGEEKLGSCSFAICGYILNIYELSLYNGTDIGIADGLLRAAFTHAVENMIVYAIVDKSVDKNMVVSLGVPRNCDEKEFSIVSFFNKCQQCSQNN